MVNIIICFKQTCSIVPNFNCGGSLISEVIMKWSTFDILPFINFRCTIKKMHKSFTNKLHKRNMITLNELDIILTHHIPSWYLSFLR